MFLQKFTIILIIYINILQANTQSGPDPWNYESKVPETMDEHNIPPDIRMPLKRKSQSENKLGIGEWFFKRTLAIVLKGGNANKHEDGSVDISLQMKFNPKQWETLDEALKSDSPLSEDMLRRSVGYVEESIYRPSIAKQIVLTWSEYIQFCLTEYKTYITWTLCFLAVAGGTMWLWSHMSHKHAIFILFMIFYAYEVVISYKEAEQQEMNKFLSAVNKCKWFFWASSCEVPPPDPLVFLKHMNPLKIGIRMFTTALAEPFVVISGTVETIIHNVTAGLWYPLDKIMFGILVVIINISLLFLLVMILFNWVLNISFSLSLFGVGVSVKNKRYPVYQNIGEMQPQRIEQADGISQAALDKILNVCSLALSSNTSGHSQPLKIKPKFANVPRKTPKCANVPKITPKYANVPKITPKYANVPKITPKYANVPKICRSASTGRLPNNSSFEFDGLSLENTVRQRNIRQCDGSGDS